MFDRKMSFLVCACLALSYTAAAQTQGNEYLFQFSNPNAASNLLIWYNAATSSLTPTSLTGPTGIAKVIPTPDGTKFYVIGTAGNTPLQSVDSAFGTFHPISGLGAAPTAATVTPDGKYLLVGADMLYVIATSSDTIVATLQIPTTPTYVAGQTLANGQTGLCISCWIAVSHDSQTAYVLTNFAGGQVTSFNLTNLTRKTQVTLPFGDTTAIGVSPLGGVYAAGGNALYQLDPNNLVVLTTTSLNFTPGALHFSPDGTQLYAANLTPGSGGRSLMQFTLANGNVTYWPGTAGGVATPIPFDDVYVASNNRLFAYSSVIASQGGVSLYDVTTSPLAASPTTNSLGLSTAVSNNILAVAISNEIPARFLFLLVANGNQTNLYRMNLATNSTDLSALAGLNAGVLEFAAIPPATGAASFIQFNNNQTVQPGAVSAPLEVRVLNAIGQAIFGQPITYSTDPTTGTTITVPSQTTNANGYAQTTITAPTTPGTYTVTVTAGAAAIPFTFTVPCVGTNCTTTGGGTGTGTTPTGTPLISIVNGDGQFVSAFSQAPFPLTVQVLNASGQPQAGAAVTFGVTAGISGSVNPQSTMTDKNGLASTIFNSESTDGPVGQAANTVTATASVGSVNFTETTYQANQSVSGAPTGFPSFALLTPTPGQIIVLPQGTPVQNAVQAQIYSGAVLGSGTPAPVPGVGIFILNASDSTLPPPAQCQGSSNSDLSGVAHCNLVATCPTAGTALPFTAGITISVGGTGQYGATVQITGGVPSKLTIQGGNTQSGAPGNTLQPLRALITDGCGAPSIGAQVTWTITQGSATLSKTVSTSDGTGMVSTNISFGQTPGPVTVKLTLNSSTSVNFTLTNQVVVAGVSLISGGLQTARTGQTFAQPLLFQVRDAAGNPLSGIQVNFTVSGPATASPTNMMTNSAGQASTSITAGSTAGNVGVVATAGTFTASASLTVGLPGPDITPASFQNSASFASGLVPCGLATVSGNGIAPGISGVVSGASAFGPLNMQVAGFSLTINGEGAPISSVSNENGIQQATFQTPCDLSTGSATAVVTVNGTSTTITGVQILAAQPGIFTFLGAGGIPYGAVIRASDGSYVTPSSPAHRGETYYLVVTGLGQTTPTATTNNAGAGQTVNAQLVVGVNNSGVPVVQTQYAAGLIGVYFVGFQIPLTTPTGTNVPLSVATIVNGQVTYGNSVFLPGVN